MFKPDVFWKQKPVDSLKLKQNFLSRAKHATSPTVKHWCGSVTLWSCVAASGTKNTLTGRESEGGREYQQIPEDCQTVCKKPETKKTMASTAR